MLVEDLAVKDEEDKKKTVVGICNGACKGPEVGTHLVCVTENEP